MAEMTARLDRAIRAAGVAIVGVTIGDAADRRTWLVTPPSAQAAAQPTIDAFNPLDPALDAADLTAQITAVLDNERLISAVVWVILRQMFPADTVAQTKAKYVNAARPQIIAAYQATPWR